MTYTEFKKTYSWIIKNAPDITSLYNVGGHPVTMTKTTYAKRGGRWVEIEKTTENITIEYYMNGVGAIPFFRGLGGYERLTKSYTKYGLIPVESVSISPDKKTRIVRRYIFN